MRTPFSPPSLLAAALAIALACLVVQSGHAADGWKQVFADEFNGTSLDTTTWNIFTGYHANNELNYNKAANVSVSGGCLHLTGKREVTVSGGSTYNYSSGYIMTNPGNGKSWVYGRWDLRAKLPAGRGYWPALWTVGQNQDWPACGEVDILENLGHDMRTGYTTLHWADAGGNHVSDGPHAYGPPGNTPDLSQDFHLYTMIWDATHLQVFLDGYPRHSFDLTPAGMAAFKQKHILRLYLAVGGDWPGSPDANTVFPQDMLVDYVRIYQLTPGANVPPTVNAGADQTTNTGSVNLSATVTDPDSAPASTWSKYDGPGTVTFAAPGSTTTTATFSQIGTYILKLNANDGSNPDIAGFMTVAVTGLSGGANAAPTVATAAAANPNPVTGTTTALSVLGADDGGEPALTYTWATTGTPPAAVAFSANATNAAKNTVATFAKAGSYTLQATIRDGSGQTVTSSVGVTVGQTLTAIAVSPSVAGVPPNGTQQFTASANDQFGIVMASQPAITWSASGGGAISSSGLFTAGSALGGPFTVTASSGATSGTGSVTVTNAPLAVYQINAGGPTVGGFVADEFFSGGTTYTSGNAVSTTGVANAAPMAVYQSERGSSTYTLPSLSAVGAYTVRLHFAEIYWNTANQRLVNVDINGARVLAGLDILTAAGGMNKALVRDFAATATAGGQIVIAITAAAGSPDQNAKISGIELLAAGPANQAPTVAAAAAATPSPVTGSTTALSVLGADDGGEPALTYTWATTGTPPAAVTFSANGSNAAKSTTATFSKAGSYTLQATIRDAGGLAATSSVAVTVNQTFTAVAVSPSSASVVVNGTQQFTASATDQFGAPLSSQPSMTWTVTGGGTISAGGLFTAGATAGGPFTVTAAASGKSGTASVTVAAPGSVVYHINCGGPAASPFIADQYFTGGGAYTSGTAVSTTGVANAAPAAVYQSERYGTSSYALPGLTANAAYTVRLHFAEIYWNAANARLINVDINGARVLSGFDIWTAAGGQNKALVRDFATTASAGGQIAIAIAATAGSADQNAKISGIEILGAGPANAAPTVAMAASASPSPVTGTTTALSALGADDAGEAALTYTWATTGTPPAAVAFSANGSNAAKATTATFAKAGAYSFSVTIRDAGGLTATSSVSVTVNQTLTTVTAAPTTAAVATGGTQVFTATAKDQFGQALTAQPTFTWTVSGGGTISAAGLFTAGSTAGGPFTVTAASGGKSGTASVTVTAASLFAVKINFQPATAPTVAGYLVDGGLTFADRGNGYSYGWNVDLTADSRDRNLISDQLRDTFIHLQKPGHAAGVWELAVPNGTYHVFAASGDPGYIDSVFALNVEGVLAVSGTPTDAIHFFDSGAGVQVVVSDGRLTISNAANAVNNKINYIEVTQVPTGTN